MNDVDFSQLPVYGLTKTKKRDFLLEQLSRMTAFHYDNCAEYRSIIDAEPRAIINNIDSLEALPFLPVGLFKDYLIKSIPDDSIFKTLTSSGTTSQKLSRIVLDKKTARYQSKALVYILQEFLGKQRLPMLIVDHPNVIKEKTSFSARGAGILGLSNFGCDHTYVLNEKMDIDYAVLEGFLNRHHGQTLFVFGFTFMVWQYLYKALERDNRSLNLGNSILLHSGGWKKLENMAVNNVVFKESLQQRTGISRIHNFYGMVEQVGSIFVECERGHLHTPVFADVLIRDPKDWRISNMGESGVIQVLSVLPHSYPGHSLLTEDVGEMIGEDDCQCGRKGRYFQVRGRIPKAEMRGCSDAHAIEATGGLH